MLSFLKCLEPDNNHENEKIVIIIKTSSRKCLWKGWLKAAKISVVEHIVSVAIFLQYYCWHWIEKKIVGLAVYVEHYSGPLLQLMHSTSVFLSLKFTHNSSINMALIGHAAVNLGKWGRTGAECPSRATCVKNVSLQIYLCLFNPSEMRLSRPLQTIGARGIGA